MDLCPVVCSLTLFLFISWARAQKSSSGKVPESPVEMLPSCQCKCILRWLDVQACKSKAYIANGSYAMDAWAAGPHCRCDCQLGKSLASFCDRMWKAEKMVNSVPDISKITTLADRLLEAVQSLDLRKLNSNLHRIQTQMKSLEQGLEAGSGLDAMLLKKSLASLHQNSGNLRGYADTMKMLAKEVFKLNLLLKQGLSPGQEKSRKSMPNVKGQHAADEGSFETRATVSPGNPVDSASAALRTEGTTFHLMPGGREETSLIHSTTPAHEESSGTPAHVTPMTDGTTPLTQTVGARENISPAYVKSPPRKDEERATRPNKARGSECSGTLLAIDPPVVRCPYGKGLGAWMKDPLSLEEKIYITENLFGSSLLEFRSLEHVQQGRPSQSYSLPCSWIGAGHLVYNGSFYFNEAFTRTIQRYDLRQRSVAAWSTLDDLVTQPTAPLVWRGYSDVTFAVDQGGLWLIYHSDFGHQHEESVLVVKLDPEDLLIRKETSWRTGLRRGAYGIYFVICGVLYTVNGQTGRDKLISYAFDTHTASDTHPGIVFPGERSLLTQLTYYPVGELLYGWVNSTLHTYRIHLNF